MNRNAHCDKTAPLKAPSLNNAPRLTQTVEPPPSAYQRAHPAPLHILWADDWLIAINKPANELSVPGKAPLNQHSTQQRTLAAVGRAWVIHRLDGATSGILLFAKSAWIQKAMQHQWRQRWVHKTYCALVEGELTQQSGTIQLPLATDWPNRPRQQLNWSFGKASTTHWRQQALGFTATHPCSRLELVPETGRTHQLRVHLMSLAHPILGDRLYHPDADQSTQQRQLSARLHLHAHTLRFRHPVTAQVIELVAPLPF